MQRKILFFLSVFLTLTLSSLLCLAQENSDTPIVKYTATDTIQATHSAKDSVAKKKYNPKVATLRSAIIPGWGQAYNKKYWKIPIVYGALGTTTYVFFFNLKTYKMLRKAVQLLSDSDPSNNNQIDSTLIGFSVDELRTYRNEYRQNIDYSVLFFLLFWGLNIVDANVDAHLKSFDVSRDVSMRIKAGINNYNQPSLSLVFFFKDNHPHLSLPLH